MAITQPDEMIMSGGPAIVLVEPSNPQNIGAVCRAMANCGLDDLRLVRPVEDWNCGEARALAVNAKWMLEKVRVYDTTAEAVGDCTHVFATTARRRDQVIPEMTARRAASEIRALSSVGARVAILFGAERTGLENPDIAMSNVVITVPLNPSNTSLNLAQAVLLVSYEWLQAGLENPVEHVDPTIGRMPAKKQQMEAFFSHVDQELNEIGFYPNQNMRQHMMEVIRGWLTRTKPTEKEIRMLHGVLTAMSGRRLGGKPAHEPGSKGSTGVKARRRRRSEQPPESTSESTEPVRDPEN